MLQKIRTPWILAASAVAVHSLLWIIFPYLLCDNLHSDTLEAAYWAQHFAFGYAKHPPLTTWLINCFLQIDISPLAAIMLLSQIVVAVTAYYIWALVRVMRDETSAFCAVFLYLMSPIATFYAVQFNHNSVLAPFYAASLYYGLRFLHQPRFIFALLLGCVAGLGFLAKYEIIFALLTLLCCAAVLPQFRYVFRLPLSYVSVLIFMIVISPHILWLVQNHFPSLGRAVGEKHIHSMGDFAFSLFNMLVGFFLLYAGTCFLLPFDAKLYNPLMRLARSYEFNLPAILLTAPIMLLAAGAILTWQVFKPLWSLSLTPSVVVGLGLLVEWQELRFMHGINLGHVVKRTAVPVLLFFSYLSCLTVLNMPLAAYQADTFPLLEKAQELWAHASDRPLSCVAINEQKIGASLYMWSQGHIKMIHPARISLDEEKIVEKCNNTGTIAVFDLNEDPSTQIFDQSCTGPHHDFYVRDVLDMPRREWHFTMFYISPRGRMDDPSCRME